MVTKFLSRKLKKYCSHPGKIGREEMARMLLLDEPGMADI